MPATAWNLVETEMLEQLASKLAEEHPTWCKSAPGEKPADELLKPAADAAEALLQHHKKRSTQQKQTLMNVAALALSVNRTKSKFQKVGAKNLKAQLAQAAVAREIERERAEKQAEAERLARAERAASARACAAAARHA